MNAQKFEKVLTEQLDYCASLLRSKGVEYTEDNTDRLIAFKTAAKLQKTDQKQALCGMMVKHTVSIYEMCYSGKDYPLDKWIEKITDHINYLLLLRAVIEDENTKSDRT